MSLLYNVSQLLKSDVGVTRSYDFDSNEPIDLEGPYATGVEGRVKFTLTNFGILGAIEANAALHLNCARCLEDFQMPVHVSFDEEYQPTIDIGSGLPSTVPSREAASSIPSNHTIDLLEGIRENLLLAMELVPVCRPDCKGLCPTCGVNRNFEACRCAAEAADSPFAALQTLFPVSEN